jgi:teichuronic acid biosynthesis glycosyltransferase TuaC
VERVHFLGAMPSTQLKWPLSASDVFVLATSNEGWANVFLEAMACGLPVITTDVGGNAEVVGHRNLGEVVPFGDRDALVEAVHSALEYKWNRAAIRAYAEENSWETRVAYLVTEFARLANAGDDMNARNLAAETEDGSK